MQRGDDAREWLRSRPCSICESTRTTSFAPSKVSPRRVRVEAPLRHHTSSTMTVVVRITSRAAGNADGPAAAGH